MDPIDSYKKFGVISIGIIWTTIFVLIYRWRGNKSMSISMHAATDRKSYIFYILFIVPALALFYMFMNKWFIPTFNPAPIFKTILLLGLAFQYVAVFIPEAQDWRGTVHRTCAYFSAALLPFLLLSGTSSSELTNSARRVFIVVSFVMIGIIGLFNFKKTTYDSHLIYQSAYFAIFHFAILFATYTVT